MELAGLRPAQRSEAIRSSLAADAARLGTARPSSLGCFAAATNDGVAVVVPAPVAETVRAGRAQRLAICVSGALAAVAGLPPLRLDNAELALAIKGVSDPVRDKITSNMSERAAATLIEEVELLGAVRLTQVEESRQSIIRTIRMLEEQGQIMVRRGGDDELVT